MATERQMLIVMMVAATMWTPAGSARAASPKAVLAIQADTLRALGRADACVANEKAEAILGQTADLGKCTKQLADAIARAAAIAGENGRFVDNSDGTVTDLHTGLMWEKKLSGIDHCFGGGKNCVDDERDWLTALTFIAAGMNGVSLDGQTVRASFAGHSDWRLPTIAELYSIINVNAPGCGAGEPCIHPVFGPTGAGPYWSATPTVIGPAVWFVDFSSGATGFTSVQLGSLFRYRAVRIGP